MPLTAEEQRELDQLEFDKLNSEKAAAAPKGRPRSMLGAKAQPAPQEKPEERGIGGLLADMALEGGGATAGQAIGAIPALSVPTAGLSIPLGGGIGGLAGNLASQKRRILMDEQKGYKLGEALSSFGTGMIPGASLEASGTKAILREGAKQGLGGLAGKTVETLIDERRLPSLGEAAITSVLPAIGGGAAQKMQAANPEIRAAVKEAQVGEGATLRATTKAGTDEGYVVPGSIVRKTAGAPASTVQDTLESVGGKAAVKQQASIDNQPVTNRLAKRAIGAPEKRDLSPEVIDEIRKEASRPYDEIEKMADAARTAKKDLEKKTEGMTSHETEANRAEPSVAKDLDSLTIQAAADIQALKKARETATLKFRQYRRDANTDALETAKSALEEAKVLESKIEAAAVEFGKPELVDQLIDARARYAKTYDVENALNEATGAIDPQKLAAAKRAGRPLSGELDTIANMAMAYPEVMKEASKVGSPGVSALQAVGMLGGAVAGGAATHSPYGALLGAAPLVRPIARSAVLSGPYQKFATKIPLTLDASPNLGALAVRSGVQEGSQELADEAAKLRLPEKKEEAPKEKPKRKFKVTEVSK